MNDCAICYRHYPDEDGCTDQCRHVEATVGNLCSGCHLRILRNLTTITEAWELSAQGAVSTGRGVSSEVGLPGSTAWQSWRAGDELIGPLNGWCQVWHEEIPDVAYPVAVNRDQLIPTLTQWLRVHLHDVGSRHEAIADFAQEIRDLAAMGLRVIGQVPSGQVIVCPGIVEDCGKRLRVNMADPEADVYCRHCGTTWTAGRLLLHGVSGDADAYSDPESICLVWGIDTSTLRRWAIKGLVRRQNGRYHVGDVAGQRRERMVGA